MIELVSKKRVIIAMSGGVDSSVTTALLKAEGYECIGIHLQFWNDPKMAEDFANLPQNKCCSLHGLEDAREVAQKLDIPFYVMNVVTEFKQRVVDYFLNTYAEGKTPNPCIECNRDIKFGALLHRAEELGADYVASGHYARIERGDSYRLFMARDRAKDQSYFLYHLTQEKLSRIIFPLGNRYKADVYELAKKFGLQRVAEKPQSQGLCFFSEGKPKYFLQRYLQPQLFTPGPMVTLDGRGIGQHRGLPLYTIGQRSGLGIGGISGEPEGEPWYVVRIESEQNRLIVGRRRDIAVSRFLTSKVHFISGIFPTEKISVQVRVRHRGQLVPAELEIRNAEAIVTTGLPILGLAGGQAVVFYNGAKVLGGAIIEQTLSSSESFYEKEKSHVSLTY